MSQRKPHRIADKQPRKPWEKPRLKRLGTIADIAGPPIPFAQAVGNKHS